MGCMPVGTHIAPSLARISAVAMTSPHRMQLLPGSGRELRQQATDRQQIDNRSTTGRQAEKVEAGVCCFDRSCFASKWAYRQGVNFSEEARSRLHSDLSYSRSVGGQLHAGMGRFSAASSCFEDFHCMVSQPRWRRSAGSVVAESRTDICRVLLGGFDCHPARSSHGDHPILLSLA